MSAHQNQRRPRGFIPRRTQYLVNRLQVGTVFDILSVPAIGLEPFCATFRESEIRRSRQGNVIVVIEINEVAQLQMAGDAGGLGGYAFHQVTVADDSIGKVIDDLESRLVVAGGQIGFGDGHPDPAAKTLTERSCGSLYSRSYAALGMAGCPALPLPETLNFLQRQIVTCKMEHAIDQHGGVAGREHEAISIKPRGIEWDMFQ